MDQPQLRQLQRRRRRYERQSRRNRLWAYSLGSPKHFFAASVEPFRGQRLWVNLFAGSVIMVGGGGVFLLVGGTFLTGVLYAAAGLLLVGAVTGWIRFRRDIRRLSKPPPGAGPEEAGVREPRRPPPGGGEMAAALEPDHDDSV